MTRLPDPRLQELWDEVEMLTMRVEKQRTKIGLLKETYDRGKVTKAILAEAINEFRDLLKQKRRAEVKLNILLDDM